MMTEGMTSLLGTLELENFDHHPFVPFNKLETLFTRDKIYELLQQHGVEYYLIDEIVNNVIDEGIRTFVILTTIDDIRSITRFIKADHYSDVSLDAKLPLKETDISRYFSDSVNDRLFVRRQ